MCIRAVGPSCLQPLLAAMAQNIDSDSRVFGKAGDPYGVTIWLRQCALLAPDASANTYLQARIANKVLKAQERRLRLQKLSSELVDRARAVDLVFRRARHESSAWLGWPARIAAQMAADLGVSPHAMQTVLESHIRQHLEELVDIGADFR
jgi:hypothetical protein